MAKLGRKSKYYTHVQPYLDRIPIWRRQGMTEEQIANKLDIEPSTLYNYKKQFVEFLECLKKGKEELVEVLEETLYKRAIGLEYEEVKTYIEEDGNGKQKKRIEKTKKIHFSDADLIFALKNLNKERWKDKQTIEIEEQQVLAKDAVKNRLAELAEIEAAKNKKNENVIDNESMDYDEDDE